MKKKRDDKLIECAMAAAHTGSINIIPSSTTNESSSSPSSSTPPFTIPTISTSCNLNRPEPPQHIKQQQKQQQKSQHPIRFLPIRIQPLLILDINGFLCTRLQNSDRRSEFGKLIKCGDKNHVKPRLMGTADFLRFLDRHFTLAVWTSANERNANGYVNTLFPKEVKSRLLFVWDQSKCDSIPISHSYKPLFIKSIHKVWMEYPLWNHSNSLLIDDNPEKNPTAFKKNALHPPSLIGTISSQTNDTVNERKQRAFFEKFAEWCSRRCLEEVVEGDGLATALKECQARSIMGWRYEG